MTFVGFFKRERYRLDSAVTKLLFFVSVRTVIFKFPIRSVSWAAGTWAASFVLNMSLLIMLDLYSMKEGSESILLSDSFYEESSNSSEMTDTSPWVMNSITLKLLGILSLFYSLCWK